MTDDSSNGSDSHRDQLSPEAECGETGTDSRRELRLNELEEYITATDPTLRKRGLQLVSRLASRDPERIRPFLDNCVELLEDTDRAVRISAARVLNDLASEYPDSVANALVHTPSPFTDNTDDVRRNVVQTVDKISHQTPTAINPLVPTIIDCLTDPNDDVRAASTSALATIADSDPQALVDHIDPIIQCLDDDILEVRLQAMTTVSAVSEESPCVLETKLEPIYEAARDDDPRVRRNATSCLSSNSHLEETPAIRSMLFERLSDTSSEVREVAASALRQLIRRQSACTPEEIEELIDALADPKVAVRTNVGLALKHAGYDDYWQLVTESDAEPVSIARAIRQTYRSSEELDPHAQLAGARYCSICRQPLSTPTFDHPNVICETCATDIVPYQPRNDDAGRQTKNGNGTRRTESELEPTPVSVCNMKCWRQFRFGELVTMRDAHDCETYSEFLQRHFTRDGTPIQSVRFEQRADAVATSASIE
ncbi:sister chromatid cohesion protein PDS5 [Natronorubrum sp. A-ect3]|uniref:sister chromatid cohesion protein PDS5 n=1 Tax=Natronorubrum sp. A-ect3 TaxID=3242698 RepID=UPI00359E69F8